MKRAAAAFALALAGCATPPAPAPFLSDDAPQVAERPALDDLSDVAAASAKGAPRLFRFTKDGRTLWVFGTMHVTPRGFRWLSPEAKAAFGAADLVLTEVGTTDAGQYNPRESDYAELLPLSVRSDGIDTRDAVAAPGSAERAVLEAALDLVGIAAAGAANARPWALCIDLQRSERPSGVQRLSVEARRMRDAAAEAVGPLDRVSPDARLERFRLSHELAYQTLEDFAARARIYATMTDAEAIDCIRARARQMMSNAEVRAFPARFHAAFESWRKGDTETARRDTLAEIGALSPAYAVRLFQAREAAWLKIIAQRCDAAGIDCAVAVGFAHLGGEDGLLKGLERMGWMRVGGAI